jgi:hypothetical protein
MGRRYAKNAPLRNVRKLGVMDKAGELSGMVLCDVEDRGMTK